MMAVYKYYSCIVNIFHLIIRLATNMTHSCMIWSLHHYHSITLNNILQLMFLSVDYHINWTSTGMNTPYLDLLKIACLSDLVTEYRFFKLCQLARIICNVTVFHDDIFKLRPAIPIQLWHLSYLDLSIPYARTSSFFYSFVPSSCRLWNHLPSYIKSSIIFKRHLKL